jgi:hypothetical protein
MNINVELSIFFTNLYNSRKREGKLYIPDTLVAKYIMGRMYKNFISDGLLTPIEYLPIEEKTSLAKECREVKDSFYTNETLKTQCAILHTINLINNQ